MLSDCIHHYPIFVYLNSYNFFYYHEAVKFQRKCVDCFYCIVNFFYLPNKNLFTVVLKLILDKPRKRK